MRERSIPLTPLQRTRSGIRIAFWFLTLLFTFVEVLPVCMKFLMGYAPYDLLMHGEKYEAEIVAQERFSQLQSRLDQEESRRKEEEAKLQQAHKEWETYGSLHQATVEALRQEQETQFNKTMGSWGAQVRADEIIQHMNSRFHEYFDRLVDQENAFLTPLQAYVPPPTTTSRSPSNNTGLTSEGVSPQFGEPQLHPGGNGGRPPSASAPASAPPSGPLQRPKNDQSALGRDQDDEPQVHQESHRGEPQPARASKSEASGRTLQRKNPLAHWKTMVREKVLEKTIERTWERVMEFVSQHVIVEWGLMGTLTHFITQYCGGRIALFSIPVLLVLVIFPRLHRSGTASAVAKEPQHV